MGNYQVEKQKEERRHKKDNFHEKTRGRVHTTSHNRALCTMETRISFISRGQLKTDR